MIRVLGLAGCIPDSGFPTTTEEDFDKEASQVSSRELWFNSVYFVLAFFPLVLAVQQSYLKSSEIVIVCAVIILGYVFFHLWMQHTLFRNGRMMKALIELYERVSGPFLTLSKLEERVGVGALGHEMVDRLHGRFKEHVVRTSHEQALKQDEQELEHEEREILRQLDGLFETRVENIMTPFSRVITVMSTATIMDSLENARLHGYSRYPVISENDEVKGVFRANQLILLRSLGDTVGQHMDEIITINSESSCYEALEIFQQSKRQFALVIAEGATVGVLTMEDILEELVGEIEDEFDQSNLKKLGSDTYLVDAVMELEEFIEYFKLTIETRSKTVNGFLLEYCGGIPPKGTLISIQGLRILILEADARKISRLRVTQTHHH